MSELLAEYRTGRNFIRVGDTVRVTPSKPGKRDGFVGTVTRIIAGEEEASEPAEVDVVVRFRSDGSTPHPQAGKGRYLHADRVQRVAQTVARRKADWRSA